MLLLTEVSEVSARLAEHVRQSQGRERSFQVDLGVGGEPKHGDHTAVTPSAGLLEPVVCLGLTLG